MELYQLRTFIAVAEEGNLSRAAERLFTSAPAVSSQIKALEEEWGVKLFDRHATGMSITKAGESLWEEAERVLRASRDLLARATTLKSRVAGQLRLGLNNEGRVLRSPQLLAALAPVYPELSFTLSYGTSGTVLRALRSHELDLCFYEGAVEDVAVQAVPLTSFELRVVVPRIWADELAEADWPAVAAKPWVFVSPQCSYYRYMKRLSERHGLELRPRFQVDEDATALSLVSAGTAVTVTTREVLEHHGLTETDAVAVWPHYTEPLALSLCHLVGRAGDPMIEAVVQAAQAVWATPAEGSQLSTRAVALG